MERVEESLQKLETQVQASSRTTELVRLDLDSRFHDVQTSVEALVHDIGTLERRVQAATAVAADANAKVSSISGSKQPSSMWNPRLTPLVPNLADDTPSAWPKSPSDHPTSHSVKRHRHTPSHDAVVKSYVLENLHRDGWPKFQARIVHLVVDAVLLPVKLSQRLLHAVLSLLGGAGSLPPGKGMKMVTGPASAKA